MEFRFRQGGSGVTAGRRTWARQARRNFRLIIGLLIVSLLTNVVAINHKKIKGWVKEQAFESGHHKRLTDVGWAWHLLKTPVRYTRALLSDPPPAFHLDIKFKHLRKIYEKRAEALDKGLLVQGEDDFVPAQAVQGNRKLRVKVRLKGDDVDHLEHPEKWSYRLHVKDGDHLFGMRRFSVQHPKTRGFITEILFFETLRKLGLMAPRYFFADLTVNGNNVGLMAIEEHFSKEMIERSQRREGVVVRFDEEMFWQANAAPYHPYNNVNLASIEAFRDSRISRSERLSREKQVAIGLLRAFITGERPPSEIFDAELTGRFIAASELWGSWHAVNWRNIRFYYNPITAKLEPVGYDVNLHQRLDVGFRVGFDQYQEPMMQKMVADPLIADAFRRAFLSLADDVRNGELLKTLRAVEQRNLKVLWREYPMLSVYPLDELRARADFHSARITRKLPQVVSSAAKDLYDTFPRLVHAYNIEGSDGPYLEIINVVPKQVEIDGIRWVNIETGSIAKFQPTVNVRFPIVIASTPKGSMPQSYKIPYRRPAAGGLTLELKTSVGGGRLAHKTVALPYYAPLKQGPMPVATVNDMLARFPFLIDDPGRKTLTVRPGIWEVEETLIVPRERSLLLSAGTTLRFAPGHALISYGPVNILGSEIAPVILEGSSHRGWQGIAVLQAGGESNWSQVVVRGTVGVERQGWALTGGVTFYESAARLERVRFLGSQAEDALNIVRSKFRLTGVEFSDTVSDALDSDFSDGQINNGRFDNIGIGNSSGGDAIDLSGSTLEVNDTSFRNIGDKALSVGESSSLRARGLQVVGAGIGAASKDGSTLDIAHSTFKGISIAGLAAYIKKPEYGPAAIIASSVTITGEGTASIAQNGSSITIDGTAVATREMDIDALYEKVMKKRPGK